MTLHAAGVVDLHKPKHRRRVAAGFLLLLLTLLVLSRQPPSDPSHYELRASSQSPSAPADDEGELGSCDLSRGEWVPDPSGPYYTNETCWMIQEHQNCMLHGRPDTGYLRWRWRPEACELRRFEPAAFFEAMRGKKMAFVGDSLARNQMQSLMCMLSRVAYPKDVTTSTNHENRRMFYEKQDFTLSVFWSPYFVRYYDPDEHNKFWRLYLDEIDRNWFSHIADYDYVVIANGNWYARPSLFYESKKLVGCNFCQLPNVTELSLLHSNRMTFRTALSAIVDSSGFQGVLFLRTMSPDHFENGEWNKGGNCVRTTPFKKGERAPTWLEGELYRAQVEEFEAAKKKSAERGRRIVFRLVDILEAMLQRPDGHPNSYGHWPQENVIMRNDCVHWCLPGPIDSWNNILFRIIRDVRKHS